MYIIAKRRGIVSKLLCLIKDTKQQTNKTKKSFFCSNKIPSKPAQKLKKLLKPPNLQINQPH